MTTVVFRMEGDRITGFDSKGHSGYAEAGADIVCAAVSALTQTALNGLANVLKAPVRFEQDDSRAFIEAELTPEATGDQIQQAQLLLVTLLEGLQAIQRGYPRNVRIIFKERR